MRRIGTLAVVLLVTLGLGTAFAQEAEEGEEAFTVTVKPMYMDVSGADLFALDEILSYAWSVPPITIEYGTTVDTYYMEPGSGLAWMLESTCRVPLWGVEGWRLRTSFWWFDTDDSISRHFEAAPGLMNEVHLWEGNYRLPDQVNFGMVNDNHPSGFSPIDWSAETNFRAFSGKLGLSYALVSTEDTRLDLDFGLKLLDVDQELSRSVELQCYLVDDYGAGFDFQNDITLAADTKMSTGFAAGIYAGFSGSRRIGPVQIKGLLSQAFVPVSAGMDGVFTDIDDIKMVESATGIETPMEYLDGTLPYSESVSTVLPITTASVDVLWRITDHWQAGVGAYWSLWHDAPSVATFSYRDMTWRQNSSDLIFSGLTANMTFSF